MDIGSRRLRTSPDLLYPIADLPGDGIIDSPARIIAFIDPIEG
jgi:hypothetical protein